jgi:hypothetical protein
VALDEPRMSPGVTWAGGSLATHGPHPTAAVDRPPLGLPGGEPAGICGPRSYGGDWPRPDARPDPARTSRASQLRRALWDWHPPLLVVADVAFEVAILPPQFFF